MWDISPSLPGSLLLLLPALPPTHSRWQGPRRRRGTSAMGTTARRQGGEPRHCNVQSRGSGDPGDPSLLGGRRKVLTAEPGFMGVAAGRDVSMWPPCEGRQKGVSLGDAGLLGRIQQGTGSPHSGLKLWRCWRKQRERERESRAQSRPWQRPF